MITKSLNIFFWATTLTVVALSACNTPTQTSNNDETESVIITDSTEYYENLILDNSSEPQPYFDRAGWHLRNGRITEGVNDLNLSIEADSTFGAAWSAKADALYLLREFDECINHLDVCLKYAPNNTSCKLRRAEMYIHLNQFEKALETLNDALRINDQLHEAYWMKGAIYRDSGDLDKALSSLQTSVEVNPNFFDGFISLGMVFLESNDPIAIDYFNSAIALRPRSVEAKYNLAMFYQQQDHTQGKKNLDLALGLYEEILEIDTMNASAAFNSGFIYLEFLQDYMEAEWWFSRAVEKLPYYHQAFFNRGLARESQDKYTEALEDYNEALRIKPDYTPAAVSKSRVMKSMGM